MLAILLIAVGLMILMGDPSVKDEEGIKRLEKIARGTRDSFTGGNGAPSPWDDFIGWFFWSGK
jgi:hypothetical protein